MTTKKRKEVPAGERLGERETETHGLRIFLQNARENEGDFIEKHGRFFEFLERIDELFMSLVAEGPFPAGPVPAMLLLNSHACYLGAVRIALSGQVPPTHMTLRGALESTLFALIASKSRDNREIWLNREHDRNRCKNLFTARNGIELVKEDPALYDLLIEAYELDHATFEDEPNRPSVNLAYLHHFSSTQSLRAISACIEVGLTIVCLSAHVTPDYDVSLAAHAKACQLRDDFAQFLRAGGYL
jgi:hypothetical protein